MLAQAHRLDYLLRLLSHTGIALVPRDNIRQLHHQRTLQMKSGKLYKPPEAESCEVPSKAWGDAAKGCFVDLTACTSW